MPTDGQVALNTAKQPHQLKWKFPIILGPSVIYRTYQYKIGWSRNCLISLMGIPILMITVCWIGSSDSRMCALYIYVYICWFNFDALAQGNAYKPTKEPMNYRGPGGDQTHDLQTEATPPAASCPACTLHATEIAPKKRNSNDVPVAALDNWQPVWNAHGVNFNTCVC